MFTGFSFLGSLQSAPLEVEYLIVAGGGAGGIADATNLSNSGGGGAGGFISGSLIFTGSEDATAITYSVSVGRGGSGTGAVGNRGPQGSGSSAFGFTAVGGGGGAGSSQSATTGGSGGGGASGGPTGASGTSGQGFAGGNYSAVGGVPIAYHSGGGGGAASTGSTSSNKISGSSAGQPKAWVDGNLYSGGGCGCCDNTPRNCYGQYTGSGGEGITSTDPRTFDPGNGGVVALRYSSSVQHFSGSSQTFESGGYFYHYCSASATPYNLVYLGNYV